MKTTNTMQLTRKQRYAILDIVGMSNPGVPHVHKTTRKNLVKLGLVKAHSEFGRLYLTVLGIKVADQLGASDVHTVTL